MVHLKSIFHLELDVCQAPKDLAGPDPLNFGGWSAPIPTSSCVFDEAREASGKRKGRKETEP